MKLPPYVQFFRDRHGEPRLYLRKKGLPRVKLPNPAKDKQAFVRAYTAALNGPRETAKDVKAGTLDALIVEYLGSNDFRELKPASRKSYRIALNKLRLRDGAKAQVHKITHQHIARLRDEIAAKTPGMASLMLKVVKLLMRFAVERGYRADNPAREVRGVKLGSHRSWTDAELLQFEDRWPRGTRQRLVYELALYTGQRRGDIAAMTWNDFQKGVIHVVQEKTGEKVWIPAHPSLLEELALAPRRHAVIVSTPRGKSYSAGYLGQDFALAIEAAGLPDDCVMHGLRKAVSRLLAENRATDEEIMAVTGHRSRGEVSRYTRDANKKTLAGTAIERLPVKPVKPAT